MIDLRNIETFFWVATLGGFRAAAEKLNATQPAISQRIALLEGDLGIKLFERDTRGIKLTAKGGELLSHAERMLQMRHDMLQAARADSVMSGTLRLGVSETLIHTWFSRLMEHLSDAYPALLIEIQVDTTSGLRAQVLSRQIDLAFLLEPLDEPKLEKLDLCQYPLAWIASPQLDLGPEPISLEQVAKMPVVTYASTTSPYRAVHRLLSGASAQPPRMYGSSAVSVIVRMACDGRGTAVVAPVTLSRELAEGQLRLLDVLAPPLPPLHYTACWVPGPDSHIAHTVAQAAQRIAAEDNMLPAAG